MDKLSGDWQLVEGHVPSDSSSGGLLGTAVNRLSNALGLTTPDEDDSEYRKRVLKSELYNTCSICYDATPATLSMAQDII